MWEVRHAGPVDLILDPGENYTDVVAALYPDAAGIMQLRATQLNLCMQARQTGRPGPRSCRQFDGKNPIEEMRKLLTRGRSSSKHIEELYYDYIQLLMLNGAGRKEVERAVAEWRENFPLSELPDPIRGRQAPARR
jgi:hypothetical protein